MRTGLTRVGLTAARRSSERRSEADGVQRDTIQRNWRIFAMVAYPITPTQGVSLSIGSGGNAGAGTDFDAITLGYQVAWGGG